MKHVLYISQSRLTYNLIQTILPLIKNKVEIAFLESLDAIETLPKKAKHFHLVIVEANCLENDFAEKNLALLNTHSRTKESCKILFHTHEHQVNKDLLHKNGFSQFYKKPFLTTELADIIEKGMK